MASGANAATPAAPTADEQVAKIFAWRRGFNAMHLIDVGTQLGLFRAFAATPPATPASPGGSSAR